MRFLLSMAVLSIATTAAAHVGSHHHILPGGLFQHLLGAGHLPLWMLAVAVAVAAVVIRAGIAVRPVARARGSERRP